MGFLGGPILIEQLIGHDFAELMNNCRLSNRVEVRP